MLNILLTKMFVLFLKYVHLDYILSNLFLIPVSVTDDFHFRDDSRLLYQFTLDFSKRRQLSEVFNYVPHNRKRDDRQTNTTAKDRQFQFHTPKCKLITGNKKILKIHKYSSFFRKTN
jgi:hypothetical protein